MNEKNIIVENLSFYSKQKNYSISKYSECLKKYAENFNNEISLKTKSIIFLDTNVLLRYYSISFTARKKLFNFIKKNKKRIVITNQVQYEFIKNRESTIQKFIEQVTNKIPKDFKSNIINKMKNFLELNKIILKDYLFIEKGIEKHQIELEKLLEKLNKKSTDKKKEYLDLVYNDKFLDLICECETFDALTKNETLLVKKHFDILKKNIENENIDSILNKTEKVFPGLGDIIKKPKDPYGDYIIFHEMMKYSKLNKKDAVFLTFDNTKGDWMSKSKNPYIHYVQNMYSNTNQILYIIDAERTLENVLKVDIKSMVSSNEHYSNHFKEVDIFKLLKIASKRIGIEMIISSSIYTIPKIRTRPTDFITALFEIFSNVKNHSIDGNVIIEVEEKEIYISLKFKNQFKLNNYNNQRGRGIEKIITKLEKCLITVAMFKENDTFIFELNIPKYTVPNKKYT